MSTGVKQQHMHPSLRVVEQVADGKGVAAGELSPLFETIDPDALDALVQPNTVSDEGITYVQFQYEGYTVGVYGDGSVEVEGDNS